MKKLKKDRKEKMCLPTKGSALFFYLQAKRVSILNGEILRMIFLLLNITLTAFSVLSSAYFKLYVNNNFSHLSLAFEMVERRQTVFKLGFIINLTQNFNTGRII